MLTNATVKAARFRASAFKLWDEGGLFLFVAPSGLRSWRWRDRRGGGERVRVLGRYPDMSLEGARAARDALRDGGVDQNPMKTFEALARAWHAAQLARWSPVHAVDVLASLERDVFPAIGAAAPADVDARRVLALLRVIEARGAIATAKRVRQRISAIFAHDLDQDGDPAGKVRAQLAAPRAVKHHPALVDIADVRALWRAIGALAPSPATAAARLQALTAVRSGALIGAGADEFEDLDGPAPLWRVPAARMKLGRAKKTDAANDHLVPLSAAAAQLVREEIRARARIFPIGADDLAGVIDRAGFAGRHCPHGWRASFSTILNEARPDDQAAIDRALGHAAKNADGKVDKVEGAYNRARHLPRRRALFDAWATIVTN